VVYRGRLPALKLKSSRSSGGSSSSGSSSSQSLGLRVRVWLLPVGRKEAEADMKPGRRRLGCFHWGSGSRANALWASVSQCWVHMRMLCGPETVNVRFICECAVGQRESMLNLHVNAL
jgi:hypothetical protein